MSFNQIIKGTILPKVPLKTLWEEDTSVDAKNTAVRKAPAYLPDSSQKTGAAIPFIKIGGQIVTDIDTMTIDETSFIPTITLTFIDNLGEFAGDRFPKTNLIMNVYLKTGNDKFKPIRCDFLITAVKSMPSTKKNERRAYNIGTTYTIKGELYVPNIYTNLSKSYAKMTSKDALKKICDELGLGFAENESAPNDAMTWINYNTSNLHFIKTVLEHSYQNDDTFFMGFIDKYYYLNYIEVNHQLKVEEAQKTFVNPSNSMMTEINQESKDSADFKKLQETTTVNYLTTELEYKGRANYITSLNLTSEHGDIVKRQGYKKNIYYYDHLKGGTKSPKDKFTDFYTTPLKSQDRDQNQFLVPTDASLAANRIKKWMNIDYGNAHPDWNASRLINSQNIKELEKIKLKVTTDGINFQVVRGFTVPVYVSIQQAEKTLKATEKGDVEKDKNADDADNLAKQTPDKQLTGYYYVSGAKYHYDKLHQNGLYTELFLARREWQLSKIIDK